MQYTSFSQSGQDTFVIDSLKEKCGGFYVEIGANHPTMNNNTYVLEKDLNWVGVGLDVDPTYFYEYTATRRNELILADATVFDFTSFFRNREYPKQIDYASVDCEPAEISLLALQNLIASNYRFSVITFEHDLYAQPSNIYVKESAKKLLFSLGYKLAKENVHDGNPQRIFEDWWIDAKRL